MAAGYLFIAPAYVLYVGFMLVPILVAILISLTNFDLMHAMKFVGLANYREVLSDHRLWVTYGNTFIFTFAVVIGTTALGLIAALLVNREFAPAFNYVFRLAFFLPFIIPYAFVAIVWAQFFSTDAGIINYYLSRLGLRGVGWLSDVRYSLLSVILMDLWKNVGFGMVIILAGLQSVPKEIREAATVDGARYFQTLFRIILPMISPVIFFCFVYITIGAMKVFDAIWILTKGGPGDSSRSIVVYIYDTAFTSYRYGYGSAAAMTLLFIIMLMTLFQFRIAGRWVYRG
jgi:multiple sugar transport system permease protein